MKNKEKSKVPPVAAVESLKNYHLAVVGLVQVVQSALDFKLVDEKIADMVKSNLDSVKDFYEK